MELRNTFRRVLQGCRSDGAPEPRFGAGFYKDAAPTELRNHASVRVLQGCRSDGAPDHVSVRISFCACAVEEA